MSTSPYAYSVCFGYENARIVYPTIEAAILGLIKAGYSAVKCAADSPLYAHYAGSNDPVQVDLTPYTEASSVDEPALRAELMQTVEDSRVPYARAYPEGRVKGLSFSGEMRYLCEYSPEQLEDVLRQEVYRRSRCWKNPLPVAAS